MRSMRSSLKSWAVLILGASLISNVGCSGAKDPMESAGSGSSGSGGAAASGSGGASGTGAATGGTSGAGGASGMNATGGTGGTSGSGTGGTSGTGAGGTGGTAGMTAEPEVLDPNVDWTAYELVYDTSYTAYDGEHTYQVPFYVLDTEFELSDWSAIPSDAVTIEENPDTELGGVLVTIVRPVEEITIAVHSGELGGSAPIHVTIGTPEEWEMGEARYNNGVEYTIPDFDFAALLDPNFMPPEPPGDLACNNCHTTGAKYFEIQHTPNQAAYYSDEDLVTILTEGKKPEGAPYRILPENLEHLYVQFHTWESSEEERKGLIMYLRSLTPEGQGDIKLPDGTYVPVGTMPMTP